MKATKNIRALILALLCFSLSGCYLSRTTIATTDGRDYKIYGNGVLLCENSTNCKIGQRGTPNNLELEAVKGSTVVGKTTIKREITSASVFWGFFTYFITLYIYQAYPDNVYIPIDYSNSAVSNMVKTSASANDWSTSPYKSQGSAWDTPMQAPSTSSDDNDSAPDEY